MSHECDHSSVGMLVWRDEKLLLLERKLPPFGFAPPAGHVDGDALFEDAAMRELREEVGLTADSLKLLVEGRKDNTCRRSGGSWHYWKIYEVIAGGVVQGSAEETKQVNFVSKDVLLQLVEKTKRYIRKEISDDEWEASPGLEPVWYEWLQELKII
ncbi:MAG: NUDIX domain-containing protein [Candidatus Azambacteria bacterium]|nr:NUDIX domain-containing protein [Candidatus Azambacteria bacterium]